MITTIFDNGNEVVNVDRTFEFFDYFVRKTGVQITSNDRDGHDPFMRSFPSLIDIGIMGHCDHGRSGLCVRAGIGCYQSGLTRNEPNMTLSNFKRIIDQIRSITYQVALGGAGDPNKHEHFAQIIATARDAGVVPNYTTSGLSLTDAEIATTSSMCGAVAVSWYRSPYTLSAIERFVDAGCITNIHYVLGRNSIDEAIERLTDNSFPKGLNAVIFLLHKPVGQGSQENVLAYDDPRVQTFFDALTTIRVDHAIGFDSCSIPGVINRSRGIDPTLYDTCEGARFSCYISPSMVMTPCSFDQTLTYGVPLLSDENPSGATIDDAWHSLPFTAFRASLHNACTQCAQRTRCYGGCPLTPEIVLCNREE